MDLAALLNGKKGMKRPAAERAARPKKQLKKPAAVGTRDDDGDGGSVSDDVQVLLLLD